MNQNNQQGHPGGASTVHESNVPGSTRPLLLLAVRGATMADKTGGSRFWSLFMEKAADEEGLFNGLRVRMGVASGDKPKDRDIKATLVWEQAKGVCVQGRWAGVRRRGSGH